MGFKLLNDLNVVERFELLERLERFELLEPPDHRLRLARQGPRTGVLGQRDQKRPGEGAESVRKSVGRPVKNKFRSTSDIFQHAFVVSKCSRSRLYNDLNGLNDLNFLNWDKRVNGKFRVR